MKYKLIATMVLVLAAAIVLFPGCAQGNTGLRVVKAVPHEGDWGIYELDLTTTDVRLVYSAAGEIFSSALRLNGAGDRLVFAEKAEGLSDNNMEIFSVQTDGSALRRLTNNTYWDLYPVWSPDGRRIAFLSKRERDLDIYIMDADGNNSKKLFDSGSHDADIDWSGNIIVFTSKFVIWRMNEDGTQPSAVTNPPGRGEWGKANLPKGDYDPRLSYDNKKLVFERLEDVNKPHGGYNIFTIDVQDGSETRLTNNLYSQGLANWAHSGRKIVYIVAAIDTEGKYDMYTVNADGSGNQNKTPDYFPTSFLCHSPVFSTDDSKVFFIGQWWR